MIYRIWRGWNRGEPFYVGKVGHRSDGRGWKNIIDDDAWYLENHTDLTYLIT